MASQYRDGAHGCSPQLPLRSTARPQMHADLKSFRFSADDSAFLATGHGFCNFWMLRRLRAVPRPELARLLPSSFLCGIACSCRACTSAAKRQGTTCARNGSSSQEEALLLRDSRSVGCKVRSPLPDPERAGEGAESCHEDLHGECICLTLRKFPKAYVLEDQHPEHMM